MLGGFVIFYVFFVLLMFWWSISSFFFWNNQPQVYILFLQGKVPLLSVEAIHQLHIFIFVLAITHVIFSVTTMLLGGAQVCNFWHALQFSSRIATFASSFLLYLWTTQIHQWKQWENEIQKDAPGNGIRTYCSSTFAFKVVLFLLLWRSKLIQRAALFLVFLRYLERYKTITWEVQKFGTFGTDFWY